jgi:putative colanic acid biosynthesis UDP-glucose lipid carrier transferase
LAAGLWSGFYKFRIDSHAAERIVDIFKMCLTSGVLLSTFFYYLQDRPYSRILLAIFLLASFGAFLFTPLITKTIVRNLRKLNNTYHSYAVIGAGLNGQHLVRNLREMEWLGLRCAFFVENNPNLVGSELIGVPVYGPVENLPELAQAKGVEEVYLSSSGNEAQRAYPILKILQSAGVIIRIMPDWGNLASMKNNSTMTIGSQVLFSAADSPLNSLNTILKESFDRGIALLLLFLFTPAMLVIAILIKLTSKGSVFHRQRRIGLDQKEFGILKFRTMKFDAEKQNGPQWTTPNDGHCTKIGEWLRQTSLDELPQLINVIKGQMSLVGPRPECPVYAQQFSEEYKKHMRRHRVKTGITGWAQIHGLRGDTSLRKGLLYDLYYVNNWSLGFDIWILLRTPWHILKGEKAY